MAHDLSDVKDWLEDWIRIERRVAEELTQQHSTGHRILTGEELEDFSRARDDHLARMFAFIETWEFVTGEEWSG